MEKSEVNGKSMGPKCDLPLAAQALGLIKFDCTAQDPLERIKIKDGYVILDNKYYYTKKITPLKDQKMWLEVPCWYPFADATQRKGLCYTFRINDADCIMENHCFFNAFIKDNEIFEFGLMPIPHGLILNENELKLIEEAESDLRGNELNHSEELLKYLLKTCPDNPRVQFAYGTLLLRLGYYQKAGCHYRRAAYWGHPDAKEASDIAEKIYLQKVRFQFKSLFNDIDNKNYGAALAQIPELINEAAAYGYAIKAYILNEMNLTDESIKACHESLNNDLMQNNILTLLRSNLIISEKDNEAALINKLCLQLFPYDKRAYRAALDMALIKNKEQEAGKFLSVYLTIEDDYDHILHNLNKYFESNGNWTELMRYYEIILPLMPKKNATTIIEYCETLIDLDKSCKADILLQRVLSQNPNSMAAVLAYSRALARNGDEQAAIKLLQSVHYQKIGTEREQLLVTAFLSELLRKNGRSEEAVALWQGLNANLEMLKIAGTRPLIEYIYCLAIQEKRAEALFLSNILSGIAPHDHQVRELHDNLAL